ncbi:uncharacterized protein LOC115232215 [Argonauta hians]
MKTLIAFCLCFCVLISSTLSYQQDGVLANDLLEGDYDLMDKGDSAVQPHRPKRVDRFLQFLIMARRLKDEKNKKKKTCAEFNGSCTPFTDKKEETCCEKHYCKCNLFWSNCRCDMRLFGG